jgi:MFS family permease
MGTRRKSLLALNSAVFLTMLGVGVSVALLPRHIMALSGTLTDVGALASAFALPYLACMLPIGNLADRFGIKRFLVAGYGLCAGAGLIYFFSETPGHLLFGRFVQGLGEAPVWALAPAWLAGRYPGEKGRVMGFYNGSVHLGLTLGGILSILLAAAPGLDAYAFFGYSVLSAAGALLVVKFMEPTSAPERKQAGRMDVKRITELAASFRNWVIWMGIGLYGAGYGAFISVIPGYLMRNRGFDHAQIGIHFSLFYMAVSLSQILAGPFSDRMGRRQLMAAGMIAASVGFFLFCRLPFGWLLSSLTVSALGLGTFCIAALAFMNDQVPSTLKGTVTGAFFLFWGIGYFTGPLLLASLGSGEWIQEGFVVLSALCFLQGVVFYALGE